jgi:hypothetical protein
MSRVDAVISSTPRGGSNLLTLRKVALYFFAALALAGAYDAMRNLPVLSGCNFYSECPDNSATGTAGGSR